ncbi:hypothetical protein VHEMI08494 [[Torrubiella] hemipterigena]|uniref:Tat pathway signal sequence n=1 Tax=[Torrubiella] hemipterigena TaxID=1531966 RepID=A0A0A1T6W2_9HYPO|nr:hypothetical protein VHEMI08494 [[Torrubiella] hemipterigena]
MDKASPSPLLRKEDRDIECGDVGLKSARNGIQLREWNQFSVITSIAIPWLLFAIVLSSNAYYTLYGTDRFHQHKLYPSQLTYSPAQDEIEYEVKMYHTGIEYAPVEFQGPPSESLDRAWDSIFNFGISTISEEQAKRMTNYTSPVPNHEDEYIIELDVFHQLHCLNVFRKAFTPIYLRDWEAVRDPKVSNNNWTVPPYAREEIERNRVEHSITPWHIGHCLESLRQSVMCHADVTPAVWHWDASAAAPSRNKPWLDVPHTCRNFDRLRQWALNRTLRWEFDYKARLPQKFQVPTYWQR